MVTAILGALLVSFYHADMIKPQNKMPPILKIYWLLWNQSIVFSLLITSSYWILLHKGQSLDLNNVLIHIMNAVLPVLDLLIVKHPPKYKNFLTIALVGGIYGIFTAVYPYLGGLDK